MTSLHFGEDLWTDEDQIRSGILYVSRVRTLLLEETHQ